ncbi:hypothetical protein AOG55_01635 [Acidiplasma cupricumulans]|uniref:AMP-dependent synthetase/ligase domain-containing protein n=1 Tax=Acidiplasma cupricumulans TaxID=312540 RepID=A0A0N8VKK8_9ARCH|nr:hypothetical protein AOG55_01635 [Acidiplasma cupricumulans]
MQEDDIYFDDILNQINDGTYPLPMEANEPGFFIYTLGTTSRPKGIFQSGYYWSLLFCGIPRKFKQ